MKLLRLMLIYTFIVLCNGALAQHMDTTHAQRAMHHDSVYTIRENIPKSKFLGNSWYIATAFNWSRANEFDVNIGRTYGIESCSGGGCVFSMRSWGAGYGVAFKNGSKAQLAKAFWEYSVFYFPPISASIRADYMYDFTNKTQYFRPSAGLSLFAIDVLYNYSFNLSGTPNIFKHGLTMRLKYFHRTKNWQKNSPSRC
jgi:hypothetical protein